MTEAQSRELEAEIVSMMEAREEVAVISKKVRKLLGPVEHLTQAFVACFDCPDSVLKHFKYHKALPEEGLVRLSLRDQMLDDRDWNRLFTWTQQSCFWSDGTNEFNLTARQKVHGWSESTKKDGTVYLVYLWSKPKSCLCVEREGDKFRKTFIVDRIAESSKLYKTLEGALGVV